MKTYTIEVERDELANLRGDLRLVRQYVSERFRKEYEIEVDFNTRIDFQPDLFGEKMTVTLWSET